MKENNTELKAGKEINIRREGKENGKRKENKGKTGKQWQRMETRKSKTGKNKGNLRKQW